MSEVHSWRIFEDKWLVSYTRPGPISDKVWDAFVQAIDNAPHLRVTVGVSYGSVEVNSVQRKKTADALKRKNVQTVVITDDRLTRGIVTAISWLGANLKAFSWADIDKAVAAIEAPPKVSRDILDSIREFYEQKVERVG